MIKRPIDYIFLEGPDLSGKTTLYESIHKLSDYRWNIQDRSALSMLVHARYYERDTFRHVEQLRSELFNLNNLTILLLPKWDVIIKRFSDRGDASSQGRMNTAGKRQKTPDGLYTLQIRAYLWHTSY